MTDYDSDYYFILKPKKSPRIPFLIADKDTSARRFRFEAQPMGSAPFVFSNANKEDDKRAGIVSETPDILFAGMSVLVRTHIREKLLNANIPHLHMHSSIYIDNMDRLHEDFWFLTFTQDFDCWDRDTSDFDDEALQVGGSELYQVYSYRLDAVLLDSTPLEGRLLFKMGGDVHGYICCHKTLSSIFCIGGKSGAELKCIVDQ